MFSLAKRLAEWEAGAKDVFECQSPTDKPDPKRITHRGWYLWRSESAKHYVRGSDGSIRRRTPKVRGKAAVKAAKRARHAQTRQQ